MTEKNKVKILKSQGSKEEYIIKDKNSINIGRFKIIDFDEENQKCDVRLKYYRVLDENLLSDVLYVMLETLFKEKYIFKVNMFIAEGINITPFLNIGLRIKSWNSINVFPRTSATNMHAKQYTMLNPFRQILPVPEWQSTQRVPVPHR